MPIDPTVPAASLLATHELSPAEKQNRYGMCRSVIEGLAPDKHVTILAVQTPEQFTAEQFAEIIQFLVTNFAVEAMQTAFDCTVPDFNNQHRGENYRNDLHLQAHLRAEAIRNESSPQ